MNRKKFVWEDRDTDLAKIIRFYDPNHRFERMFYRTNLLVHTRRLESIMKSLIPYACAVYGKNFDPMLAMLISRHHDDTELVTGDTSLQRKLQFNKVQREKAYKHELEAIDFLCSDYPEFISGYRYRDILLHVLNKDCKEAQLHSFIDKRDGQCEAIHEVLAGNSVFLEPVFNYIQETFAKRNKTFFLIKDLFKPKIAKQNAFLQFHVFNLIEFFQNGKRIASPHTPLTVSLNTKIPFYEEWKRITIESFPDGMHLLTNQIEFVP